MPADTHQDVYQQQILPQYGHSILYVHQPWEGRQAVEC